MQRSTFRIVVAAGAAIGLAALAGCGGSSTPAESDSGTVVFWDTSGPDETPVFSRIAQDCAQKGGYKVQVEQVPFAQAKNNFKTAAQGGQGPDVLRTDVGWVAELAKLGLLADLSDTDAAKDTGDYNSLAVASTKYDGKTYGVPQVIDTMGLYYNKKLLDAAGVAPPKTYDEIKAASAKLGGDKTIFINPGSYYALPFIYSAGADLVDPATKKITVSSPKAVEGLQAAKGLLDAKAARTSLDSANAYNNIEAAFKAGEVAMIVNGPWAYSGYLKAPSFSDKASLGVTAVPGPTGPGKAPQGGHDYTIRQGTKAKPSSLKFIQCMSSTESQVEVSKSLGLIPTRKTALDNADAKASGGVAAFGPLLDSNTQARPSVPEYSALIDGGGPLAPSYLALLGGTKDAKAAADEAAQAFGPLLPGYTSG
ncbi:MAG: extracellular solute-binding protein [Pseudonocardiales bacterium]|nr:extracellular solute-binding protein [Pseudonocardiales bacterium]